MIFIKRQLAIVVMISMGFLALAGQFINSENLREFTDKDAPQWYMIIAAFAAFLGCINLLQLHSANVIRRKKNWQYSIFTLGGFLLMIFFGFFYKGLNGDPYKDLNNNNKWDDKEKFIDINCDGEWNEGEEFIDIGNGKWDVGEEFTDKGNGKWDEGEIFFDIGDGIASPAETYEDRYGNYEYDIGENFIDTGNAKWDIGEDFIDIGNGKWDDAEEFIDLDNGKWDSEEQFIDIGNGKWDEGEDFIDINNNCEWDNEEDFIDKGNGKWDNEEEFTDKGNGKWDLKEKFIDANYNGQWDDRENFIDLNNNGVWNFGEKFTDIGNGEWDNGEEFIDIGNGQWDVGEEFTDKGNGKWDNGEDFIDMNNNCNWDFGEEFTDKGNGKWDGEKYYDTNNNKEWNQPEEFIDLPDKKYTEPISWGSHLKSKFSAFYWMYQYIYLPLSSTMFALLAFFVASASYRAFRIRNFEATLLLISGVLLMIGRVPIGALIPWWSVIIIYTSILFALIASYIKEKKIFFYSYLGLNILAILLGLMFNWHIVSPSFLSIPLIQEWIMAVPATAGSRAIMIGIALGVVAQSFRIITGRERSILGD